MIVDDHAVIRAMLRAVFEAEDLEVSDAVDGADGVRKAQEIKPHLIILDLSIKPVMNGLQAARALKLLMPLVPLLMFTNNAGGDSKEGRTCCRNICGGFEVRLRPASSETAGSPRSRSTSRIRRDRRSTCLLKNWRQGRRISA